MPPVVKGFRIPDWANPDNASVLDSPLQKAARTIGSFLGINDPQSQIMGLAAAPIDVPAPGAQTLRAYHGSPYDFDRFDASKIGTGEGAQAYGHGLYFAENEGVAKGYRHRLSDGIYTYEGKPVTKYGVPWNGADPVEEAKHVLAFYNGDKAQAKAAILSRGESGPPFSNYKDFYQSSAAAVDTLDPSKIGESAGRTYEVTIHASPDELLDWDKPLSQQPQKVQEAVTKAAAKRGLPVDGSGTPLYIKNRNPDGQALWASLVGAKEPAHAADLLKDAGIKGIQYLDQGSRAAGQGTRNFVIFDDKIIDIARKYGLSLPAAAEVYRAQQRTKPQPAQTGVE